MGNSFEELINVTGITEASFDVIFHPINIIDLIRHVSANDIIFFDVFERDVWVVYTNKNDSRVVCFIDKDFIVKLGQGNFPTRSIDVKENFFRGFKIIVKCYDTKSSGVNVNGDGSVGSKFSGSVFNSFPVESVEALKLWR